MNYRCKRKGKKKIVIPKLKVLCAHSLYTNWNRKFPFKLAFPTEFVLLYYRMIRSDLMTSRRINKPRIESIKELESGILSWTHGTHTIGSILALIKPFNRSKLYSLRRCKIFNSHTRNDIIQSRNIIIQISRTR